MNTDSVDKEPELLDSLRIKEELSANQTLAQEVAGESCDPLEDGEAGTTLEDEEGDCLLHEEADDNRGPWDC